MMLAIYITYVCIILYTNLKMIYLSISDFLFFISKYLQIFIETWKWQIEIEIEIYENQHLFIIFYIKTSR